MTRGRRILNALLCACAVAANGTGALAQTVVRQEKTQQEKIQAEKHAAEVLIQHDRIMIDPHSGPAGMAEGMVIAAQGGGVDVTFVANEMAFDRQVVRGAPFSAEAVTESVQVLGDGNRITRKMTSRIFRDGEGRTRREQTLNGIGPWATADDAPQTVFINDPVGGANYILNSRDKTAQKLINFVFMRSERTPTEQRSGGTLVTATRSDANPATIQAGNLGGKAINRVQPVYPAIARAAGAQGEVTVEVVVDEDGAIESAQAISGHPLLRAAAVDAARQWRFSPTLLQNKPVKIKGRISFNFTIMEGARGPDGLPMKVTGDAPASTQGPSMREREMIEREMREREGGLKPAQKFPESKESLGRQTVEGVEAEGTRTTVTIPAGSIGNDRAIQIVSERWYSPELQTVVMTRHSDPRFGETTYRLTNISRSEPDRSLFEVPADFKLRESGPRGAMPAKIIVKEQ